MSCFLKTDNELILFISRLREFQKFGNEWDGKDFKPADFTIAVLKFRFLS